MWSFLILIGIAFSGKWYIDKRIYNLAGGPLVPIIFAKNTIEAGQNIKEIDIEIKTIPQKYAHIRAIPAKMRDSLYHQKAAFTIEKGEPLLFDNLQIDDTKSLSDALGITERAITLRVDYANSLQGMLEPSDRVDVMALVQPQNLEEEPSLQVIVQNAFILAIDGYMVRVPKVKAKNDLSENTRPIDTITLKVSPSQAAVLAYAQTQGRLMITLRNKQDVFITQVDPVNSNTLSNKQDNPIRAIQNDSKQDIQENLDETDFCEEMVNSDMEHSETIEILK